MRHKFKTGLLAIAAVCLLTDLTKAQNRSGYWQQRADYRMEIDFDTDSHRFDGYQELIYTNNSPDTLDRVFYHLYLNAFQPGSMMDKRSRTIEDPDSRVGDRIYYLKENETGYQMIDRLEQDGERLSFKISGTVLEAELAEPLLPNSETRFVMEFEGQVPVQIRRTGRRNEEGIDYSMSQWYPKMAEYDFRGWHPHPYIGREFHGVFGRFDVKIHMNRDYSVAATGYLQNPDETGYGYEASGTRVQRPEGDKLTWHFISDLQHDFMWAADRGYRHATYRVPGGPLLRFFYQTDPVAVNATADRQAELLVNWEKLPEYTAEAFSYMNEHFGDYPYEEYIVAQGGDGGMEYGMGTLVTGNRNLQGLVGVTVHELVHAWYQGVLANNESYDHWMDEGFTVYASTRVMHELFGDSGEDPFAGSYNNYFHVVRSGIEEPMARHADHYHRNTAYSVASYTKGMIFLHQLSYITGRETFDRGMRRFFNEWKFRHPTGYDFIRVMEQESGLKLDWYHEYWVKSTRTIDYGIEEVTPHNGKTRVMLRRHGQMPMPVDLEVEYWDGSVEHFYIPMRIMRGQKEDEFPGVRRTVAEDWPWVYPDYTLTVPAAMDDIVRIEIDPTGRMADTDPQNHLWYSERIH
ncbi:MAG: M1 family metallopeptidase [Balneolaceae bacterium]